MINSLKTKRDGLIREYLKNKKRMSDLNINYFIEEFDRLTETEKSEIIYEMVGKEVYKEKPVDIKTFINDPYFLGDIYGGCLFKIWRNLLDEIYPASFCKKHDIVVLSCATRCFGKSTEILMYDGSIKKVEDIVIGDKVMGPDRTPRNVLSLTHGRDNLYNVSLNSGDRFICNSQHILPLYNVFPVKGDYNIEDFKTITVEDYVKNQREGNRNPMSPYSYMLKLWDTGYSYNSFEIEELEEGEFFGFTLDGDHLFLLSNGVVAHNCGKTYITAAILMYEIYMLTCMINPTKTLQVANIVIACLSKDNATAVSQLGSEIYKCLSQSPYFKGIIKDKLSFSKVDKDGVRVTEDIIIKAGSSMGTVIGTNLYAGCVDEICAPSPRIAAENHVEVKMKLYQEMFDRRRASYDKAPKMTGMLMFTSSPTDEGDVLSEIIEDVKKKEEAGDAFPLIRDNIARWVAREEDTSETFQLFLGSDTKDPCVVDESIVLKEHELDKVIEVPVKYLGSFQSDAYKSIQDIAGRRTMPETALFSTVAVFERVFSKPKPVFRKDTPVIQIGSSLTLDDYLIDPDYFSHPEHPECYRYVHLDMAYRCDRFGMTSVYSDRVKYTSEDGHEIWRRKYFIDFCLGITSKNKETVDILKVLEFIYSLKERGYPLKIVTTDNHQGEIARQAMTRRGVKTDYLSMEKSKEQYLNMKNLILTEAVEGYENPDLMRELRGLRESAKKIEKGKGYTDDMSDSLAGALWTCSQDRFYKKNNEAISEIIQQTGNMNLLQRQTSSGFAGLARQLNRGKGNNLGFRYF